MPHYVRAYTPGGSYFFTVALLERRRHLLTEHINALRTAFTSVRRQRPFRIDAIVVLPDHLHGLWTLPPDDADYSTRWRLIKASFARSIALGERLSDRRQQKGERGIWQRRFWEHAIRDPQDFEHHCDYIHYNPVKHGLVTRVADWPHSSFHRFVENGVYPLDWAGHPELTDAAGFGE
ncbi:MAG TPA: transposase [Candidatus Competibacteraceae bacterium]|nr:transposase [Candidatus Competibacteraceae bacterium]